MTPVEQTERKGLVAEAQQTATWLRQQAVASSKAHKMMAKAKSDRNRAAEGQPIDETSDYSAPEPEQTREWKAADLMEALISSDARPAPMPEEVKDALYGTARVYREILSAHIDDLTRKVAEAEAKFVETQNLLIEKMVVANGYAATIARLSRPQETDAVLAERDALLLRVMTQAESDLAAAHAEICKLQGLDPATATWPAWSAPANTIRWFVTIRAALSAGSRPSPGPATEADRKDGWWISAKWKPAIDEPEASILWLNGEYWGHVRKLEDGWVWANKSGDHKFPALPTREEAQATLLASVRSKQEGV